MRVHLLPIGGAGVSALARLLLARGHEVSGCDLVESATTRQLAAEGARIAVGHAAGIRGGALAEVAAARAAGLRVLTRAELLAELLAEGEGIAVAGTHGKTTVTYMAGHVLTAAGYDPTVLVGDGASSRAGRSRWLVAEADESDGSLALHRPRHGVLTSVEFDHPDHFAGIEQVDALFREFVARLPGVAVVCADYPRAAAMPAAGRRVTYGFAASADYRCLETGHGRFDVERRGERLVSGLRLA